MRYKLTIQQIRSSIFYRILRQYKMERNTWKEVRHNNRNHNVPNARWGHSCCVIEDEVIYFGGYADSTYMNDLWSFNTITMEWKEVETVGEIPSPRSNCSINYDRPNNKIIVFGGGGPNKVRYNSINILDWKTKEWTEITPKLNQPAPWERTYHTAELFSHYLITFGGEGLGDLDDLWLFDFQTFRWTEVPVSKTSPRPSARRFHSSAIVNNQFFVIAGCYGKYRCLSDIYSIDLTSFLQTGKVSSLSWRDRKMKEYTFLTRWGHTSAVYQNKICVFGGRFCNDLNDILIIDPSKDLVSTIKVSGEVPKARRRHSACFLGNSMLVFGGFNGQYYNDLHYISIKFPKKKPCIEDNLSSESLEALTALKTIQWQYIGMKDGQKLPVCVGLLIQRFSSVYNFDNFLRQIDGRYANEDLKEILMSLYRGYGKIELGLTYQFGINIHETRQEYENAFKKSVSLNETEILSVVKRTKQLEPVILLDEQSYAAYLQQKRMEECYFDVTLNVNDDTYFRANKALLALNSQYFYNLFTSGSQANCDIIKMPFEDVTTFQTILNYLSNSAIVASSHATHAFWISLLEMADYLSLTKLVTICENELLSYISEYSSQQLLIFALKMDLDVLGRACSEVVIKRMVNMNREQDELLEIKQNQRWYNKRQLMLKRVYNLNRFDLLQKKIGIDDHEQKSSLNKKQSTKREKHQEQKQNNEIKN